MNQQFYKNMALWVVILVMMLLLVTMFRQDRHATPERDYTQFLTMVEDGDVVRVTIGEGHIEGETREGETFKSFAPAVTEVSPSSSLRSSC